MINVLCFIICICFLRVVFFCISRMLIINYSTVFLSNFDGLIELSIRQHYWCNQSPDIETRAHPTGDYLDPH